MLEIAGLLMYAMFYVFVVVVLLNALIAVMSEVYSEVEVMCLAPSLSAMFIIKSLYSDI